MGSGKSEPYRVLWETTTTGMVLSLAMPPDAEWIACTSDDEKMHCYDRQGDEMWTLPIGGDAGGIAYAHAAGRIVASSRDTGRITTASLDGRVLDEWDLDGARILALDVTPDAALVGVGLCDGGVRLLDTRSRRELWRYETEQCIPRLALCSANRTVLASSIDDTIRVISWAGHLVWQYDGDEAEGFAGAAMSVDGNMAVVGGDDAIHCLAPGGRLLWRHPISGKPALGVAVTPRGECVAATAWPEVSGDGEGGVCLIDGEGSLLWQHHMLQDICDVAITSDGRFLAVGTTAEVVFLENLLRPVGSSIVKEGLFAGAIAGSQVVRANTGERPR